MAPARSVVALLVSFLAFVPTTVFASVLAIDYGTDWSKASLMKPGIPFDVLLNKDSKRKIHSSVAWKRDDRLFSTDAFNLATRFPADSFPSLKHLLGKQYSSNTTWFYNQVGQGLLEETERGTVGIKRKKAGGIDWTVEELIAMQFAYIRELAQDLGGDAVHDVVLSVPPYFSQHERQAVIDAITIAGMRPLALINDGTAVAVNYAMTRTFPTRENHIIYDAGAGSIKATVVSFVTPEPPASTSILKPLKPKPVKAEGAHIEVKGFGWDTVASGNELSRRLKQIMIKRFDDANGWTVDGDPKPLARLWKEAERVKAILSANADSAVTIEALVYDVDFKTKVSRTEFEAKCKDLVPRFTQPIFDALHNAGLTLDDITSVILTGGSSRTPMVQAAVKSAVGESKIAQNVNADESVVLGSAFYGASLSPRFRTKKIKLQDISAHDIQVIYEADAKSGSAGKRLIKTVIYPAGAKTGVKKTLTLKRKDDFSIRLAYKTLENTPEFPQGILDIDIANVTDALTNLTAKGVTDPVVKITLLLSAETGMVSVQDAVVYGEAVKDAGSIADKLKGFFGGASSESSTSSTSASEGATPSASSEKASETDKPEGEKESKKEAVTLPLTWTTTPLSIPPMTEEQILESTKRLIAVDRAEQKKRRQEEARNALEGYTYRLRDLLTHDEHAPFFEFSTVHERDQISKLLDETMEWLSESAEIAETKDLRSKKEALENLEKPIQMRLKEYDGIPLALADLEQAILAGHTFLKNGRANITAEEEAGLSHRYTTEEVDEIETTLTEIETWLKERLEAEKDRKKNEDSTLSVNAINDRGIRLQKQVMRLINRRIPKPPKKVTTTSTSVPAEETGAAGDAEATLSSSSSSTSSAPEETHAPRDEL